MRGMDPPQTARDETIRGRLVASRRYKSALGGRPGRRREPRLNQAQQASVPGDRIVQRPNAMVRGLHRGANFSIVRGVSRPSPHQHRSPAQGCNAGDSKGRSFRDPPQAVSHGPRPRPECGPPPVRSRLHPMSRASPMVTSAAVGRSPCGAPRVIRLKPAGHTPVRPREPSSTANTVRKSSAIPKTPASNAAGVDGSSSMRSSSAKST